MNGSPATPQDLMDGSRLSALFNGPDGAALVQGFQQQVAECLDLLLIEDLTAEQVMWQRAKAIGLLQMLDKFGYQMGLAHNAAVLDASRRATVHAIGRNQGRG